MSEYESEIWSEYFRVKNTLMDYDENLRNAISNLHMFFKYGMKGGGKVSSQYLKAQKHVGMILDLALVCGAFPQKADTKAVERIQTIARGGWKNIDDFDFAQQQFRTWYQETGFYRITITKDNRPAAVRKYG